MNLQAISNLLGNLLLLLALTMTLPLLVGLYFQEEISLIFIITMGLTFICGSLLKKSPSRSGELKYKEGFVVVTLGWLLVTVFGSLPFFLSGLFSNPVDALFESVSGFTTTGATVIMNLESLSKTMLFWRSLTHWLGGMGIIVMTMAVLPQLAGNMHLYRAEVPGPLHNRIKPRIQETAQTLWYLYILLTFSQILLLYLSGLSLFEASIHSFGTVSTGGFSSRTLSVRAYNNPGIETIVIIFMFISGINFQLLYEAVHGRITRIWANEELRLYTLIVVLAILLVAVNLYFNIYNDPLVSLRYSAFQVVSISSTTGFATVDYDTWPPFSRWLLLILMFIGGSAGSTAGGIKVIRIKLLLKKGIQELFHLLHPRAIRTVKIDRQVISDRVITGILGFFFLYITVFVFSTLLLTHFGIDIISSMSAVAAALGNVGPGLELVGPLNSYLQFPPPAKLLLACCMLMGRLEIYTILVFLFMDWK